MKRITIVSGIQLSTNPRVVKEADTLSNAGYDVTVLGATLTPSLVSRDAELVAGKAWRYVAVIDASSERTGARLMWLAARLRLRAYRELRRLGLSDHRQLGYAGPELLAYCLQNPADLYILHNPQSLWVGVKLLESGRNVAVDMEDWYSEDIPEENARRYPIDLLDRYQRTVLKDARYATTTSRAMSDGLAARYGCPPPAVVYNSFSLTERRNIQRSAGGAQSDRKLSIVWFSQVIGHGRGLEALIDSLGSVLFPVEINLIGNHDKRYAASLRDRAPAEWKARIHFHEQVPHGELISAVAACDVSYAGELPTGLNKKLTVSNKILLSLLAGVPVVASDTEGHREVAAESGEAVALFAAGDPIALAAALNSVLSDRTRLSQLRADARDAAERAFCWEKSAPVLLAAVKESVAG